MDHFSFGCYGDKDIRSERVIELLKLDNIGFSIQEKEILRHISLEIAAGQFVGIIGPNGSGKSTMLKIIYRHFKQTAGIITLHENEIWDISAQKFAQKMAVVSQESALLFDFTVRDLVLMAMKQQIALHSALSSMIMTGS